MQYRELGRTGLKVSLICLGTMNWGEQNSEKDAHEQMDFALEKGVNFFDTAEMYPVPPKAEIQGRTELYIGTWFKARKNRDKIILATKIIGGSSGPSGFPYIRDGKAKPDRKNIAAAVETSLKRLQTDIIDLYQLHWPDRSTNTFGRLGYTHEDGDDGTPLEETLAALAEQVKAGKIRHVGLSNETPWGTTRFLQLADAGLGPRMVSVQNP